MAVIDRPIILPKLAFLTAWGMLEAGELPPAFGTNLHHWTSSGARRELEIRAMAALTDLGLARNNRLNSLWRSTVGVLAEAACEYYAFCAFADGQSCSVLIAARAGDAVRAIIDDNVVSLEPIEGKWFATALLDTLPEVPAAQISPTIASRDAVPGGPAFTSRPPAGGAGFGRGNRMGEFGRIEEVMELPRRAVHQIYLARRDAGGPRRRSTPITAIDTDDAGRVLVYIDGQDNLVMTPGSPREFVVILNDTFAAL
ncbi:ESX secretion-associated protein EspG [Amycolatopsis sp. cg9]|uniref:ESX secretion-associated protein EspG n=1 Tax=Amycolatopsis sp. cg9 TaxID=3238801 RepID=UPI003523EC9E